MGIIKYSLGNFTEAQADLEKAYSLSPGNAAIKSDLEKFYLSQGMNDKANALK
jgi:tetratricopeptide (TPR) repeat protein